MPRKSDERGFGFRAEGLLRILVGADAEQVLIAIEALGFRLPDREVFTTLTDLAVQLNQEAATIIIAFFARFSAIIENAIFELDEDPAPGEAEAARALETLIQLRKAFVFDLAEKRALTGKAIETAGKRIFIEPPTPGTI